MRASFFFWQLSAFLLIITVIAWRLGGGALAQTASAPLTLPAQIGDRLSKCWTPPRTEPPRLIEVTVRLSFSRAGAIIGEPRVVYIRAPAEAGLRESIASSVRAAVKACTPLPFSPALGAAIAGRIFAIRLRSLPLSGKQRPI
ncbi:MAG: hypothetical protein ACLPWS_09395 [Rhodomicrobium sp.]